MGYVLADPEWLSREVQRVRGVLLQNMVRGQEYTVAQVLTLLANYGLHYDNPTYTEIGAVLLADGFLVDV